MNQKTEKYYIDTIVRLEMTIARNDLKLSDILSRLEAQENLNYKLKPVERAVRNALPKDAVNMTTAAKYFGVDVFKFNRALREQTTILYRKNSHHNLVNKAWRDLGYMAVENSQPFVTKLGVQYIEGMIKRGELRI